MSQLRFDGQAVVITDAYSASGKAYTAFFASRGANLVINELPQPVERQKGSKHAVHSIVNGLDVPAGKAVGTCESVVMGEKIVERAISEFGRIDVLINNASFNDQMEGDSFDSMLEINIKGAYKCTKAAWPHFRRQAHGRVITTASVAGRSQTSSRISHSGAKLALLGFTETLAKEGAKYNIMANLIAPKGSSYITETSISGIGISNVISVISLVALLVHPSNKTETGSMFEVDREVTKLRWERAQGALLNPGISLTPSAILQNWPTVNDFTDSSCPQGPANFDELLPKALALKENDCGEPLDFRAKVALITGAGAGLGRSYALAFARLGASVVVNDISDPRAVVQEIRENGGIATASTASVEDGDAIVETAIRAYGRIDIVVNNAGFVRDKAFVNMTDELWDSVIAVHMRGTHAITMAAWPYFLKQGYGRVVNTTSTSGIYGSFGQANYAAAKLGILGLSDALAREGAEKNIHVNTIAPVASTGGLAAALSESSRQFKPEYIAPLVLLLSSDKLPEPSNGGLFEVACGWHARTRLQRSAGHAIANTGFTQEAVLEKWNAIVNFDARNEAPAQRRIETEKTHEVLNNIERLKRRQNDGPEYVFDDRDVILYNLSVGAQRSDLPLIFEGSSNFQVVPTFGIIPLTHPSIVYANKEVVPNFNPTKVLHGEHYLEIRKFPIPTSGKLKTTSRLIEVIDKGNAAITITGYTTKDSRTQEDIFYNELSFFIRGSGGFGGQAKPTNRGAPSLTHKPPPREPDAVAEQKTSEEQAALYRLTGDRMDMHIDPEFSKKAEFPDPILHGACFFGFAGRHVYQRYGPFKKIKVRFVGTVIPGQTLRTEMWRENERRVVFQTRVMETGKLCIAGGGAELLEGMKGRL